jgi:hypothetical protein
MNSSPQSGSELPTLPGQALTLENILHTTLENSNNPELLLSFYNELPEFKQAIDEVLLTPENEISKKLMPLAEKLIFEKMNKDDEIAVQILLANGVSPLISNEDGLPLLYCAQTVEMRHLLEQQMITNLAIKESLLYLSLPSTTQTEAVNLSDSPKAASLSSNTEQEAAPGHASAPLHISSSTHTMFTGRISVPNGGCALPEDWYKSLSNSIVAQPQP